MKLSPFWKKFLTFGLYTLFASYRKKNPSNDYTLIVETVMETRLGAPVSRAELVADLFNKMENAGLTPAERDLALALLKKKLDKAGIR